MSSARLVTLILVIAGVAPFARPAHSGWSTDPVTVRATTAQIPLVAGSSDGGFGTFVSWQEEATAGTGSLLIQHLMPTGDLDPAWPGAGALASNAQVSRDRLGMIPDRLGGAYVWWIESGPPRLLYFNRLVSPGIVAPGWPARGRLVGAVSMESPTPTVISDGANGIYFARTVDFAEDPTAITISHFGPGGGLGGRSLGSDVVPTIDLWPQIALAPDGGVYVAWGSWSQDETALPSSYRLTRLTSAGGDAPGWSSAGISLGSFHADWLGEQKQASLLALAPDGRGGVWAVVGDATEPGPPAQLATLLYRLQGDGQSAADWPATGRAPEGAPGAYWLTGEPASYRAYDDHLDGVILGMPQICTDCVPPLYFMRVTAGGASSLVGSAGARPSLETFVREDGGLDIASCQPTGPTGPFQPPAFIAFSQTGGPSFSELHNESAIQWFGDVGLASCGADGAVFFWSQTRERFGLFARRFSLAGQVTAVEPDAAPSKGLRLAFIPGRGIVARMDLANGAGSLRLYDIAGRLMASRLVEGSGRVEVAIPSTTGISSGLYFAQLVSAAGTQSGKVVVAR